MFQIGNRRALCANFHSSAGGVHTHPGPVAPQGATQRAVFSRVFPHGASRIERGFVRAQRGAGLPRGQFSRPWLFSTAEARTGNSPSSLSLRTYPGAVTPCACCAVASNLCRRCRCAARVIAGFWFLPTALPRCRPRRHLLCAAAAAGVASILAATGRLARRAPCPPNPLSRSDTHRRTARRAGPTTDGRGWGENGRRNRETKRNTRGVCMCECERVPGEHDDGDEHARPMSRPTKI